MIYLHRYIMKPDDNMLVDHINGDPTDNRKSNMRICDRSENAYNKTKSKNNKSGYKGVYWDIQKKKWMAQIGRNKRTKLLRTTFLGYYETPELAHEAYCKAAKEAYGEYAHF